LLGNPKMLLILIVGIVVLGVALYGGALGAEFGGGYLGAPLAAIQIPAESITADAIIGDFHITMGCHRNSGACLASRKIQDHRSARTTPGAFRSHTGVLYGPDGEYRRPRTGA